MPRCRASGSRTLPPVDAPAVRLSRAAALGRRARAGLRGVVMWSFDLLRLEAAAAAATDRRRLARVRRAPAPPAPGGEIVLLHDGDFRRLAPTAGTCWPLSNIGCRAGGTPDSSLLQ